MSDAYRIGAFRAGWIWAHSGRLPPGRWNWNEAMRGYYAGMAARLSGVANG